MRVLLVPTVLALALSLPAAVDAKPRVEWSGNVGAVTLTEYRSAADAGGVPVASMTSEVRSDSGIEDVKMVESDSWLQGVATLSTLPVDATVTLTLYDSGDAPLSSFKGTLRGNRLIYGDVGVLGQKYLRWSRALLPNGHGSFDAFFEFVGETGKVTYGVLTIEEVKEITTCDKAGCTTTGTTIVTKTDVVPTDFGSVWEGSVALDHRGLIEVVTTALGSDGKKLEQSAKVKLGAPWTDGEDLVNCLATDEDPLTTVALLSDEVHSNGTVGFFVASDGWTLDGTLPVDASIELEGGVTVVIPANSYQQVGAPVPVEAALQGRLIFATRHGETTTRVDILPDGRLWGPKPTCANGFCIAFAGDKTVGYEMLVTSVGSAKELTDKVSIGFASADGSTKSYDIAFGGEVSIVFANEVDFSESPVGLDLAGEVSLLAATDKNGKQKTLAKGKFFGTVAFEHDSDLSLAGTDKDTDLPRGDLLRAGKPISWHSYRGGLVVQLKAPTGKEFTLSGLGLGSGFGSGWARVTMLHAL